jgi:hypothetical protein
MDWYTGTIFTVACVMLVLILRKWIWPQSTPTPKIKGHASISARSTNEGDVCTTEENAFVFATSKCPDCGGALYEGPSGGGSVNIYCGHCGSKFNLTLFGTCERLSDAGDYNSSPWPTS